MRPSSPIARPSFLPSFLLPLLPLLVLQLTGCGESRPASSDAAATPAPATTPAAAATPAPAAAVPSGDSAASATPAAAAQATTPPAAAAAQPAASAPAPAAASATPAPAPAAPATPAPATPAPDTAAAATTTQPAPAAPAGQPAAAAPAPLPDVVHATIHVPEGDIHVSLFHKTSPITVENFVTLARKGFYDGLAFHRVEPGFVVQGGDPNTREGATGEPGTGGPGYTIPAELPPGNPEKHTEGTLGMADSGLNTAGSQFYITLAATPNLDGRYTVFGRVDTAADLEVAKQIKRGDRFTVVIEPQAPAH